MPTEKRFNMKLWFSIFDNQNYKGEEPPFFDIDDLVNWKKTILENRNVIKNEFLELAVEKLGLSTRAHHKILKIARTLADMTSIDDIQREHLIEALSYRAMDRLLRHLTDAIAV